MCGSACKWLCNPTLIESAACVNDDHYCMGSASRLACTALQLWETPAVPRGPPPLSSDAFRDWLPPLSSAARQRAQKAHVGLQIISGWLAGWLAALAPTHQRRANTRHLFVHVLSYLYSAHVHSSRRICDPCVYTDKQCCDCHRSWSGVISFTICICTMCYAQRSTFFMWR